MKKHILGALALSVCMFSLASCFNTVVPDNSSDSSSSSTVQINLDGVKQFLQGKYPPFEEGRTDYELVNSITFSDVTYTIEWTVDIKTEGAAETSVVLVKGEETTKVDVDETSTIEVEYELVGVISAEGQSTNFKTLRYLNAIEEMVSAPIAAAPKEDTAYKLSLYSTAKAATYYFVGEMSGYYGKTDTNAEKAIDIYAEYAEGSTTNFYLYFMDGETEQYISVTQSGTHTNFGFGADKVTQFVWNEDIKSFVTSTEVNGNICFLGTYDNYVTFGASPLSKADTSYVGQLVGMVKRSEVAAETKIKATADEISLAAAYVGEAEIELPAQGGVYPDAKITWAAEGATINEGKLVLAAPTETKNVTVTATITCGDKTETKSFTVASVANNETAILAAAKALASGAKFGNNATLTGTITSVDTAYDSQYANITVTMDVNGTAVQCYRMVGTGADTIKAGYKITVTGTLKNYNGTIEFDTACNMDSFEVGEPPVVEPEEPTEGVLASLDMMGTTNLTSRTTDKTIYTANGVTYTNDKATSTTDNYNQTGTYAARAYQGSTITLTYTSAFKAVVFTLDDYSPEAGKDYMSGFDGMTIAGATITRNNDVVTINFETAVTTFTTANLLKQIRIEKIELFAENVEVEGGETPENPGTPDAPVVDELTGKAAVDALYALASNESKEGKFTITGKITALDSYTNPTIVMEGDTRAVFCYKLKNDNFVIGATITVTATTLKNYNGTYEMMNCTLVGEITPPAGGETPDTPVEPETNVPTAITSKPVENTAYKFYMLNTQTNVGYYFTGAMSGYYGATSDKAEEGVDLYVEYAEGSDANFYIYFNNASNVKQYITITVNGTHVNFNFAATGGALFTWDETLGSFITVDKYNDAIYYLGTYGTYTTIGTCKSTYTDNYAVKFVTMGEPTETPEDPTPDTPVEPDEPTTQGPIAITSKPVENTAYKFYMLNTQTNVGYYFTGAMSSYYGATSDKAEEGVDLYVEYAEGSDANFYIYFNNASNAKQYITVTVSGTHVNFGFAATGATPFTWNETIGSFVTVDQFNGSIYFLGTYSTYTTIGTCKITYTDNYVVKFVIMGEVTETPEDPTPDTPVDPDPEQPQPETPAGETLPSNLVFTGLVNKESADAYMKANYADWTITGKLGNGYGDYLGFGRSGDVTSAITSTPISTEKGFTLKVVLKGNGSNGVATSKLVFTLVDKDGNVVATGYANETSDIVPADAKDTTYTITFQFVEGKSWADVANLKISFTKATGNIGMKSLEFIVNE